MKYMVILSTDTTTHFVSKMVGQYFTATSEDLAEAHVFDHPEVPPNLIEIGRAITVEEAMVLVVMST